MLQKDVLGLDIIVESERDQRTLDYLISTCGFARVRGAREKLPGETRPYVSNLAKFLGVTIPIEVLATPQSEARQHITELKERLAKRKWD
ncbi:cryptic plasmid protein A [Caballeronia sp. SBC1]|uniref:cryptic plasmid protein A n=1 Tax=Caballeronia sp. SBC1 TaxID=2705548 RepID=UPI00140A2F88|nr:cryptic plasmid protein A [Caballeronia sp. SBC1]